MNVVAINPGAPSDPPAAPLHVKRVGRVKRRKKLPKAAKAIAWGKPDRACAMGVCASMERLSHGSVEPWRPASRLDPLRVALGWIAVVVVCSAVIVAGAAVNKSRGSHERTDVSHVQL